jgi:ribA/ribD-fused uncharacterized protein
MSNDDESTPKWMKKFEENMLAKMEVSITKAMAGITVRIEKLEETTASHTAMFIYMKQEQNKLSDRMNQIEARSMRENLIFAGVPESENETSSDLRGKITKIIEEDLHIDGEMPINRCHRLPKPQHLKDGPQTPRNVVVRFVDYDDVAIILKNAKHLKDKDPPLYINQQLPKEIMQRRRILYPVFQAARSHKMKASLVMDKLYIDGALYTMANLHKIPFDISYLHEKNTKGSIAFLGRFSSFSNLHHSSLTLDDVQYNCSEQYFQAKKAKSVGNTQAQMVIMMADDPADMKYTGDNGRMTGAQKKHWDGMKEATMREALMAKFSQNCELGNILINTNARKIAKASTDPYWGCGKRLNDPQLLQPSKWTGKNTMGKLLASVRKELSEL